MHPADHRKPITAIKGKMKKKIKVSVRNKERAGWAQTALEAFCRDTGQTIETDGSEEVISDFLCDLMHYCDEHKLTFEALLTRGRTHYAEETDTACVVCGCRFCGFDEGDEDNRCNECAEKNNAK